MEILLQDLLPGQEYLIQLRAKNQNGVSQWSRAYSVTTTSDVTAPSAPTGLTWNVSGTSFVGEWTAPLTDSNGQALKDFKDFKVTLTADSVDVVFYVSEPRFDLSLSRNIASWGSPQPSVDIKVEARDNVGNLSAAATASATNSIPSDVAGFDSTSALGGVNLVWDHVADDDLKQYEIYVGGSSGFTPGPSNLKVVTTSNSVFYATDILTLQYFKIRAVDAFNQGSANYAVESQVAYPIDGVVDTEAPSQPSAPVISTGVLVAQVSHDMTKQTGGDLESDVDYLEIHASTSSGFTPDDSTMRGTIDSAGQGIPVSAAFFFPTTDSMTNLYWKVIAVDRSKNRSSASNQATGLPNLIENANILNATITDGKIQNLSAAKLIAGSAIVNDLFIESNLTVSDTGTIESENFSTGISGWQIAADGSVEFNDGLFRGDLELSTTYDSQQFSIELGNMDSNFIWYSGESIDGQEPTLLFRGWSFKEVDPDTAPGVFSVVRDIQSIIRLTPLGEFQILFDPSHTSDPLSIDGNNLRDAAGDIIDRYYGWVDHRIGMGVENDTSFSNSPEGRNPFSNSYYWDTAIITLSPEEMAARSENQARIQGFSQADGSEFRYRPRSEVRLSTDAFNVYESPNLIQDGLDVFDNAGGVAYYNSNTVRNRITINSIPTNLRLSFGGTDSGKLWTGLDCTVTAAGAGNPSIAFTTGSTTYPIPVTPGDEYFMAFHGYHDPAYTASYRFFMKLDNGTTIYGPTDTFQDDFDNRYLAMNSNYNFITNDLLVVPSGATAAHFGIEFIGTVGSDRNIRISGVQVIKAFHLVSGQRELANNFYYDQFMPTGFSDGVVSSAEIVLNSQADVNANLRNPKLERYASIQFNVDDDGISGGLGSHSSSMTLYASGLKLGSDGEPRLPHGEFRYLSSSTVVSTGTVVKLSFTDNKTLDTFDGSTMSSFWTDMGIAMDTAGGYTAFVPQRAGLYLVSIYMNWSPGTSNEYFAVELIRESPGAYLGVHQFGSSQDKGTATFCVPLSAGERVYLQVYASGPTKTLSTSTGVSFVQLI